MKKCLNKQCAPSDVARVDKGKKEGGGGAKEGRGLGVYTVYIIVITVLTQYLD